MSVQLPMPVSPLPRAIHPEVQDVHRHALKWVRRWRLVSPGETYRHFGQSRFATLAGLTLPDVSRQDLQLAADVMAWGCLYDHAVDESTAGREPKQVAALVGRLFEVLNGEDPMKLDLPLVGALADLRRRLEVRANPAWLERWVFDVEDFLLSSIWQGDGISRSEPPTLGELTRIRQRTSGIEPFLTLAMILNDVPWNRHLLGHKNVWRLLDLVRRHICWVADLFGADSIFSERTVPESTVSESTVSESTFSERTLSDAVARHGIPIVWTCSERGSQNMVDVLSLAESLRPRHAARRVTTLCDQTLTEISRMGHKLLADDGVASPEIERLLDVLLRVVQGNLDGCQEMRFGVMVGDVQLAGEEQDGCAAPRREERPAATVVPLAEFSQRSQQRRTSQSSTTESQQATGWLRF